MASKEKSGSLQHKLSKRGRFVKVGSIKIYVLCDDIAVQSTDVVINSAVPDLTLSKGRASKALLEVAGDSIQLECKQKYKSGITSADVAVTGPGKLQCKVIYHVTLPTYRQDGDEKELDKIVKNCLEKASGDKRTSLSFPALGTGFLKYPTKTVVQTMFNAVETFSKRSPNSSIKFINFVVYKDNKETLKEFLDEAKRRASSKELPETDSPNTRNRIGQTDILVTNGSIVTEEVEVILCCGPHNMKLGTRSGIAKTLDKHAGSELQAEIDSKYQNGIRTGELAVLRGHLLKCQKILYGCLTPFYAKKENGYLPEQILYNFVKACLEEATKMSIRTIAIPAFGSGYLKFPVDLSAYTMINAIRDFLKINPNSCLREIRIIVFDGDRKRRAIKKAYIDCLLSPTTTNANSDIACTIPNRGTKEFLSYRYTEDPRTPPYWTHFHNKKTVKEWNTSSLSSPYHVTNVDETTKQYITKAFENTGSGFRVISIERIENILLYEKYIHECQRMFRKAFVSEIFTPLENVSLSTGTACTMQYLNKDMTDQLSNEINEFYLFHGTKVDTAEVIIQQGLDRRLASSGLLGTGVYTAEMADKSAAYTNKNLNGDRKMFMMRVCLGDIFIVNTSKKFCRPPCRICLEDTCTEHSECYDSVAAQFSKREFVVYESCKCYPEYIITFRKK